MAVRLSYLVILLLSAAISIQSMPWNENAGFRYANPGRANSSFKPFGRWECRFKAALAPGTESCIGLYSQPFGAGVEQSDPHWMECDIEIGGGWGGNHIEVTPHVYNNHTFSERPYLFYKIEQDEGYYEHYYTYTIEFTPEYVCWSIDGKPFRLAEVTQDGRIHDVCWRTDSWEVMRDTTYDLNWIAIWSNYPMRCAFDIWYGPYPDWLGVWSDEYCGATMYTSYFAYFAYTPGEGPGGTDFTLDDFDSFDEGGTNFNTTRWEPYNVVMRDGKSVGTMSCNGLDNSTVDVPFDAGDTVTAQSLSEPPVHTTKEIIKAMHSQDAMSIYHAYNYLNVEYSLQQSGKMALKLYRLDGSCVKTISSNSMTAGNHAARIATADLSAGTYMVFLARPEGTVSHSTIIVR
jgi:hypothetical protein